MSINLSVGSKIAIGLVSATGVAVGGYVTNEYLLGTKITELLKENDLVLLTKNQDEEQWKKRWKEYVTDSKNKWGLSNYENSSKNTDTVPENFKDTCIYRSSLKVSDNKADIYKEVSDFCTKGFAISNLIEEDQDVELITAQALTDPKWQSSWGKYFDTVKDKDPLGLSNLTNAQRRTVPNNYKTQCDAAKDQEVRNRKDPKYLTVRNWCTSAKTATGVG